MWAQVRLELLNYMPGARLEWHVTEIGSHSLNKGKIQLGGILNNRFLKEHTTHHNNTQSPFRLSQRWFLSQQDPEGVVACSSEWFQLTYDRCKLETFWELSSKNRFAHVCTGRWAWARPLYNLIPLHPTPILYSFGSGSGCHNNNNNNKKYVCPSVTKFLILSTIFSDFLHQVSH